MKTQFDAFFKFQKTFKLIFNTFGTLLGCWGPFFNQNKVKKTSKSKSRLGKKFLLRHFFGQVLNRKNPSFIRASLLSKEYFISPRFCLLEFKITSTLEKYFSGFIHV
jgi:hypothetical protein